MIVKHVYTEDERCSIPKGWKVWRVETPAGVYYVLTRRALDRLQEQHPYTRTEIWREGKLFT